MLTEDSSKTRHEFVKIRRMIRQFVIWGGELLFVSIVGVSHLGRERDIRGKHGQRGDSRPAFDRECLLKLLERKLRLFHVPLLHLHTLCITERVQRYPKRVLRRLQCTSNRLREVRLSNSTLSGSESGRR